MSGILERIETPMAKLAKKRVYWDSDVFISLIDGDADRIDAIRSVVDEVESGKAMIVVSTLVRVEVLPNRRDTGLYREFQNFLKNREQVREVAIDRRVIEAAQQIRESGKSVKTPDAIHLATAIVCGVPIFHTYDKLLIRLSGVAEIKGLTVCEPPEPSQSELL